MQDHILPKVIFAPATLALGLTDELTRQSVEVTLFTPGPVTTRAKNITANLQPFEAELALRNDTYLSLLKKHPLTFITLARQVQAELLKKAFDMANCNELDVLHIYTNEEELGLVFSDFCKKPVVFTHHDPFNLLVGYRSLMPQYKDKNWLALSNAQKADMPSDTHWLGTIYHGLDKKLWGIQASPKQDYVAYIGRLIHPKGVSIAIRAVQLYNQKNPENKLKLKIAGKHYADNNDSYWKTHIEPALTDPYIEYVGFIGDVKEKQEYLSRAKALLVPSLFAEPFGIVMIEALACSTPVIGLDSGAIPEIIENGKTGFVVKKELLPSDNQKLLVADTTISNFAEAITKLDNINPADCKKAFEARFTTQKMAAEHKKVYQNLAGL